MSIVDLHTHSTASDGQYTPRELVGLAKKRGVEVLAITDHDNIDGLDEAVKAGNELGLRVIRGVELSADDHLNLHILGYHFPPEAPGLREMIEKLKAGRSERKYKIRDYLAQKGIRIDLREVDELADGGVIGRPHFAQIMVKNGYVSNNREAFDRYLDTPDFQKFDRGKPSAEKCVKTIKAAGGKVSLAHPYQIVLSENGDRTLEALIERLTGYGLDALECYYPKHTPEQEAYYLSLARRYGLHVTGGSDFHGERVKPDVKLAKVDLNVDWLVNNNAI